MTATTPYYWCATHHCMWVAYYLHQNGRLGDRALCQRSGCRLERLVSDPSDAIDLSGNHGSYEDRP